jgi:hypothetical protein
METRTTRMQRKTAPQMWKPRYLAYAAANGKSPEAMLDADATQWPGDEMRGYKQWLCWAWKTWDDLHEYGPDHDRTDEEQEEFTTWLVRILGVSL